MLPANPTLAIDPAGHDGTGVGSAARVEAASRYSFDRMVAAFDDLYVTQLTRRGVIAAGTLRLAAS